MQTCATNIQRLSVIYRDIQRFTEIYRGYDHIIMELLPDPHLGKDGCLLCRVTKGVYVPSHPWSGLGTKRVVHKPQPQAHLINDGVVISGGLIVHTPSSVDKLQLFVIHEVLDLEGGGGGVATDHTVGGTDHAVGGTDHTVGGIDHTVGGGAQIIHRSRSGGQIIQWVGAQIIQWGAQIIQWGAQIIQWGAQIIQWGHRSYSGGHRSYSGGHRSYSGGHRSYSGWGAQIIQWGAHIIQWGAHIIQWGAQIIQWGAQITQWGAQITQTDILHRMKSFIFKSTPFKNVKFDDSRC